MWPQPKTISWWLVPRCFSAADELRSLCVGGGMKQECGMHLHVRILIQYSLGKQRSFSAELLASNPSGGKSAFTLATKSTFGATLALAKAHTRTVCAPHVQTSFANGGSACQALWKLDMTEWGKGWTNTTTIHICICWFKYTARRVQVIKIDCNCDRYNHLEPDISLRPAGWSVNTWKFVLKLFKIFTDQAPLDSGCHDTKARRMYEWHVFVKVLKSNEDLNSACAVYTPLQCWCHFFYLHQDGTRT